MDSLSAKNLPHTLEAEQALLGACILNNEAINQAVECDVRPEDFFLEAHREIYAALAMSYSMPESKKSRGAPRFPFSY